MCVNSLSKSKWLTAMLLCSIFVMNSASPAIANNSSKHTAASQSIQSAASPSSPLVAAKKTVPVKFPALKGPYQVGTETFHWIDQARPETFTADKNDHRELMIQVWYPTQATSATHKRQPYADNPTVLAKHWESYLRWQANQSLPLLTSTTHSLLKAPIAHSKQKYPVLVFSHGFGGRNDSYRFLVEPLASQGYIVVSIQHTYSSALTTFPTGKSVPIVTKHTDNVSFMERLNTAIWVKDAQFVLDRLEHLAQSSNYHIWKQLDLKRIGMLGHSFGGAASAQVMLADNRVKAGINMDGTFFGKMIPDTGLPGPFLVMSSADGLSTLENAEAVEQISEYFTYSVKRYKQALRHSYSLSFAHANHYSFSDFPLIIETDSPNSASILKTNLLNHQIINEYTLDFFDHFLKGKPTKLLHENKNKYEDVKLKIGENAKTKR